MRHTCKTFAIIILLLLTSNASAQDPIAKEVYAKQLQTLQDTGPSDPAILRLDVELEDLLSRAKKLKDGKVRFLASGLSAQRGLYATFGMRDLRGFAKYLLGMAKYPKINLHRDAFANRDLSAEVVTAYRKCSKLFGKPLPKAPVYKVAFGYQRTTNAQMQGFDRRLGRHVVVLNRSALALGRLWDAAIIHETWHCFQKSMVTRKTLLARALHEGVVTHLTQMTDPTLKDHTVMLWSEKEWDAATKLREEIVAAFAKVIDSTEQKSFRAFMILGGELDSVKGAPSRCGYYVGLLAARAWQKANPKKSTAALLDASDKEIWAAFTGNK